MTLPKQEEQGTLTHMCPQALLPLPPDRTLFHQILKKGVFSPTPSKDTYSHAPSIYQYPWVLPNCSGSSSHTFCYSLDTWLLHSTGFNPQGDCELDKLRVKFPDIVLLMLSAVVIARNLFLGVFVCIWPYTCIHT